MSIPLIATKLYVPAPRSNVVLRPHLLDRLKEARQGKLTLVSAPAGFGKTTLISEWVANGERPTAWLSLDEGDNDPARFLTYLIAALQSVAPDVGKALMPVLQAPQPPIESILTSLLNEITTIPYNFIVVLDDYHVVDSKPVDSVLTFLLNHLPPQMHLVIATREDPSLALARLRARGQLTELRVTDLRFSIAEATEFLNRVMGLDLTAEDVNSLEHRTEGWIAGLQLAAISMQGHRDTSGFVKSFTGSHHFVMDYLVEEVLQQQPDHVQTFLLHTSILNRLCGSLCDAVLLDETGSGQKTLETIEQANLFIIPLDNERRWYRYHHLFADLLRQRLYQSFATATGEAESHVNALHIRASQWYEDHGLELEAFHHAATGNDIERTERLIGGKGLPLHLRGAATAILDWLKSLPTTVLDARPSLWWLYGAMLLVNGQNTGVQEKLDAAEAALNTSDVDADDKARRLIGRIAAARATLALTRYQAEAQLAQSRRALAYLSPSDLSLRATANWTMGIAYQFQKDYATARQALSEAIALGQACGDLFTTILATIGLGAVQEADAQLSQAAETYQRVLHWAGDQPQQIINEAHLGLARIFYEWNDLDSAERHGRQSLVLAHQYDSLIDRYVISEVFLARLKLARGDVFGASETLAQTSKSARQQNFVHRLPEVAAAQVLLLLRQGNLAAADQLVQTYQLPLSQARLFLARGDTSAALATLDLLRQRADVHNWHDERLRAMVLQALAQYAQTETDKAVQLIETALVLAEPGGYIRLFVDEGVSMAHLLAEAAAHTTMPDYVHKLIAAFDAEPQRTADTHPTSTAQPLIEPLSQRELEVLHLIAQGFSNNEIGERLFLALDTIKGYNRKIFDKLHVQRRTEAVARARELGLL